MVEKRAYHHLWPVVSYLLWVSRDSIGSGFRVSRKQTIASHSREASTRTFPTTQPQRVQVPNN